jgi:hypothetical protein
MNPIDKPEIWLPPGAQVGDEARIVERGLAKGGGAHAAAGQEGLDLGKELLSVGHGRTPYRTIPINQEDNAYFPKNRELPTSSSMDAVRKLILEKVASRDTNLAELSRKIGRNHAYLQQFIHRGVPVSLPEDIRAPLAVELGVTENELRAKGSANHASRQVAAPVAPAPPVPNVTVGHPPADATPGSLLFGDRDLPVFGTAEGGKGALVLSNEPVDWVLRPDSLLRVKDGYGVIVTGDSMSPEHKPGSTALVNPHIPARSGDTCIFRRHDDDGTVHMCIKELVRATADAWHVRQHNPPKAITLKRTEWQICHVTVGNYFRR